MRFCLAELDGCRRRHGGMLVNPAFRQSSFQPLRACGPLVSSSAADLTHRFPTVAHFPSWLWSQGMLRCNALMLVKIMQAVISASFSVAKLRSGAQSDVDGKKKRDQRRDVRQPPPPQSLAPWHTLPYMGREVRGCNNPSHGAYVSEFCFPSLRASRSVQVHYLAGVLRHKVGSRLVRARRRCAPAASPHQPAARPAT
jgi:hypothetical protein